MKKALLIFRKDCRHLWPEISLSFAVLAAFIAIYPIQWNLPNSHFSDFDPKVQNLLTTAANVLTGLVPVTWFVLIARVVHTDSLIGNRQFWLTRPYDSRNLLTSKVIFLIAFIYVPFLIAQSVLLLRAGFSPTSYFTGLLFNLLLATGILIVPLFALASVTSTFIRIVVTLLIIAAAVGLAAWISSPWWDSSSLSNPYGDRVSIPLVLASGGAVIIVQYTSRRTWLARSLMLALPIAMAVAGALLPFDFDHAYPQSGGTNLPFKLAFAAQSSHKANAFNTDAKLASLALPIEISGISFGYAVSTDDVTVTFVAYDGSTYTTPWRVIYNATYLPGQHTAGIDVQIDRKFLDRVRAKPVTIRISLALTSLEAGRPAIYPLRTFGEMNLPGFGICRLEHVGVLTATSLSCRRPMRDSPHPFTLVTMLRSSQACDESTAQDLSADTAWEGNLDWDPSEFGITSVWIRNVNFDTRRDFSWAKRAEGKLPTPSLCSGTPLTLTPYKLVKRGRFDFVIPNVTLPEAGSFVINTN